MEKKVLCLLHDGFEEIEVVTPVDLLRRAGVTVVMAAMGERVVTGRCGIRIEADAMIDDLDAEDFDMLFIPGGPGVAKMREDGRAEALARVYAAADKSIAAICAAPLILMDAGLLNGRRFTAYESVREELGGGLDERVVVDDSWITSRGAGTALDFGLAMVAQLYGQATADHVADQVMA